MFIGREHECSALDRALEDAMHGRGGVVLLAAEAGMGTTTLVREWWTAFDARSSEFRDPPVFAGTSCKDPLVEEQPAIPLRPWIDIIARLDAGAARTLRASLETTPQPDANSHASPTGGEAASSRKRFDLKRLIHEAAPSWGWALPVLGDVAHAAMETSRLAAEQRRNTGRVDVKALARDAASAWALAVPLVGGAVYAAMETQRLAEEQRARPDLASLATNQDQVFQQFVLLVSRIAEQLPVVIFLDDAHLADAQTANLLFHLGRNIQDRRILVIAAYMPGAARATAGERGHALLTVRNELFRYGAAREIALPPWDRDTIERCVRLLFGSRYGEDPAPNLRYGYGAGQLGAFFTMDAIALALRAAQRRKDRVSRGDLAAWLATITEGNPLFVLQYIDAMLTAGVLDQAGAIVGDPDSVDVPRAVRAVLEERLARIDENLRTLLAIGAVEGDEFTTVAIERLSGRPIMPLLKDLQRAVQLGLIVERGETTTADDELTEVFAFASPLMARLLRTSRTDVPLPRPSFRRSHHS